MPQQLARRTLLRGVGVTLGLPWLEAMTPDAALAASRSKRPLKPKNRMVLLYAPNGVHRANWYPEVEGAGYEMTPALKPLEPYRSDILVLGGLDVAMARLDAAGDHAKAMGCYLTGVHINKTAGDDIQCGVSADQVIAKAVGGQTRFASLELGLDYGRMEGGCDPGYACIYSNNVSWTGDKTPATKEVNPRILFDRLFGAAGASDHAGESRDQQETYNRSILDYTRQSLRQLTDQLGVEDRHRVDEYLTSIREIERRIDAPPTNAKLPPGLVRPTRVPETLKEHFQIMADLLVLALQQDVTRVSTFLLGIEQSRRTYAEIGIPEEHHGLTHHAGNPEKIEKVCRIDNYLVQQYAYILGRMKSVREGDRTLLDNAMVVYGNGNGDGARHDHESCATIVAGRGAGTLEPGRYVKYAAGTPICNLWLSLMDRMDCTVERHGDSTGRLTGLAA